MFSKFTVRIFISTCTLYLVYLGAVSFTRSRINIKDLIDTSTTPVNEDQKTKKTIKNSDSWIDQGQPRNCTSVGAKLLVYNRVPKCGSTTIQTLLRALATVNNFTHRSSNVYSQRHFSMEQAGRFARSLSHEVRVSRLPLSIDRHFYYINLAAYGLHPVYINMMREPIERVVSSFYYDRSPERWERLTATRPRTKSEIRAAPRIPREVKRRLGSRREGGNKAYYHGLLVAGRRRELARSSWASKNLTSCVLEGDKECAFVPGSMRETAVTYFCGSYAECLIVSGAEALQRAKYNLETAYSVVGIVEDFELSLAAMERYVPRFLSGMRRALATMRSDWRHRNSTPHPEPLAVVRDALSRNLTGDIELYQFARQRLHRQLTYLGLTSN